MAKRQVLLEIEQSRPQAFGLYVTELGSPVEAAASAESVFDVVAGLGVELTTDLPPVPMVSRSADHALTLMAFATETLSEDVTADTVVIAAEVEAAQLPELAARDRVTVWDNSPLTLLEAGEGRGGATNGESLGLSEAFDAARSNASVDCRPFKPAATVESIRTLLGVERVWRDGFRGQNIVVGIIDEGVNGDTYPVVGGFARPNAQRPGTAAITSHGSMCAADVLVAAPAAKIYDYPFLGIQNSGGALQMFQAALSQRRIDGTPQVLNNSYGFVQVPPQSQAPLSEIWNLDHPLHRKVREVVTSRALVLFAAGNCGHDCPSSNCHPSGIGAGKSIHGSNSLTEVLTIAAVNASHDRIGYSSEGPGMFDPNKPDLASYSHFFGNFGPGRPGGVHDQPFDSGTSAATPVAAGVVALLLSALPELDPALLRDALIATAVNLGPAGFDHQTGHGVLNAAAAYTRLTHH